MDQKEPGHVLSDNGKLITVNGYWPFLPLSAVGHPKVDRRLELFYAILFGIFGSELQYLKQLAEIADKQE